MQVKPNQHIQPCEWVTTTCYSEVHIHIKLLQQVAKTTKSTQVTTEEKKEILDAIGLTFLIRLLKSGDLAQFNLLTIICVLSLRTFIKILRFMFIKIMGVF